MRLEFLDQYNRIISHAQYFGQAVTDAGWGKRGFVVYFQGDWAYGLWPVEWYSLGLLKNITFSELFPVVVALTIWR